MRSPFAATGRNLYSGLSSIEIALLEQDHILSALKSLVCSDQLREEDRFHYATELIAKHRSELIADDLIRDGGNKVRFGPFAGMSLLQNRTEGSLAPKLLGSFECELHDLFLSLPDRDYPTVVNLGCGDGYVAIGLARLMPGTKVIAYDVGPSARSACEALARENSVSARLQVTEAFTQADCQKFAQQRAVFICDLTDDEVGLLDPKPASALRRADILLVLRGACDPTRVTERFEATHHIRPIARLGRDATAHPELVNLDQLNQFFALWEWPPIPTHRVWMTVDRS